MKNFSNTIMELRYSWDIEGRKETWEEIAERVVDNVFSVTSSIPKDIIQEIKQIIKDRKFIPGGRFLAQAGRNYHQTNNCFLFRAEDTREGWAELNRKATLALMSGGGIGIEYSDLRPYGSPLKSTGGFSSGPIPLMKIVNEVGRGVMSGGKRRSAIWASLSWKHQDILDFISLKNWIPEVRALKEKDFDFPAVMDMTNISVTLDKDFFIALNNPNHSKHSHAKDIYWKTVERMVKTGEPGFSVNYQNERENLRNACTEIVSDKDSDVCCLGSINLGKIKDIDELIDVTKLGQLFLIMGTEYSNFPFPEVKNVRDEYRRTGLGLMGIHEWLLIRNKKYDEDEELAKWLDVWSRTSDFYAETWSKLLSFNIPIAKRSIAPNGTISIAGGETTSGIEPIFAVAYQRRFLTPSGWKKQYVVDPIAQKLVELGINPLNIEDAYSLSLEVERRIKFQNFIQKYVDNGISSTINLPEFGKPGNDNIEEFGNTLYKYLPNIRGITCYPNGARGGQPLVPVDYEYAMKHKNKVFEANEECNNGICGL